MAKASLAHLVASSSIGTFLKMADGASVATGAPSLP